MYSSPRAQCAINAARLLCVPLGKKSPASLPARSAMVSCRRCTVGSSPHTSSPTSARIIAAFMPSLGRVTVSLRKSIMRHVLVTGANGETGTRSAHRTDEEVYFQTKSVAMPQATAAAHGSRPYWATSGNVGQCLATKISRLAAADSRADRQACRRGALRIRACPRLSRRHPSRRWPGLARLRRPP
ncbi:protein of unknown function [Paraburkholderia kururiensis]